MSFALQALNRIICTKDLVLYLLQFEAIVSYIANSVSPSFGWDDPDSIVHAFVCIASLIHQAPHYHIDLPHADLDKKSLFMNILQVIEDHQLYSSSFLSVLLKPLPFLNNLSAL